jgi:hypothetical protein
MNAELVQAVAQMIEQACLPLRERIEQLEAELHDGATAPAEPVGLKQAARLVGVSPDTIYRNPARYGGWKVDPSKPHSQWRFDPERVREARGTAAAAPIGVESRRRQRRSPVPLLPVKDRAA